MLPLTIAMSDYDHVRDLATGRVRVEGVDLRWLDLQIEEIFHRFTRYHEWDVSELSLCKYVARRAQGDGSLVAIPVFPSRVFRHSSIYVGPGGPTSPDALRGARIGVPEWAQTAAVYSRGLLVHDYDVPLASVEWYQAGVNEPGRGEKVELALPPGVRVTPVPDRSLDEMLRHGDLDAVLSARAPNGFLAGDGSIVRMIEDHRAVEADYARRTGVFPIMHVVVVRADVYEANRWVAANLLGAFEAAKARSLERLADITASRVPLPWVPATLADSAWLYEGDPWPYGIEPNRRTLEMFVRFAHEQGVTGRTVEVDELFAPETSTRFVV